MRSPPPRRFRHLRRLFLELWRFAAENKAWWIVPFAVVFLLLGALLVAASFASPFLYTVF